MNTIHDAYADLVKCVQRLGSELSPATAVRYEAPPQSSVGRNRGDQGVKNPTLDIVLDARRTAVSSEIDATRAALQAATRHLSPHIEALRYAVAVWEGHADPSPVTP